MLKEIEQLLILQNRDSKISTMKLELKMAPAERAQLEQKLESSGARLESAKLELREIEVERKKLENEAQSKRDGIAKFKTQQFQTRKNEEFQALNNEISRHQKDIQTIEDRELELMENAEKVKAQVKTAEGELQVAKTQINRELADIDAKTKVIETHLKQAETEREQLSKEIEEDLLERYERLFASKGDVAVVELEHEVCMGCHMKITTQTAVRVKAKREIMSCEQCGRILYIAD